MAHQNQPLRVAAGIFLLMACHVAFFCFFAFLSYVLFLLGFENNIGIWLLYGFLGIGITQFLYAIPLWFWLYLHRRGRSDTAKGIAIGVVLTLLLNGGCFVVLTNTF